jgi:hypothetical protein
VAAAKWPPRKPVRIQNKANRFAPFSVPRVSNISFLVVSLGKWGLPGLKGACVRCGDVFERRIQI